MCLDQYSYRVEYQIRMTLKTRHQLEIDRMVCHHEGMNGR
jgi:hypothetical protein